MEGIVSVTTQRRFLFRFVGTTLGVVSLAALVGYFFQSREGRAGKAELLGLLTTAYGAEAVALDPAIRDFKLPEQIPWKEGQGGNKSALLYGDPSKPGFYVQLLKRGPNVWSKPHFHDNDRFITVLEGTFWVGTGKFDPERTVPLKPGSFVRDIANGIHFDGSKDDGTTLYFVGMGPASAHPAEPKETPTASASAGSDPAATIDPAIREIKRVEDMPAGSVNLFGNQNSPGVYVQYLKRAPNAWSRLHYHPMDRLIMVMGGRMYIGTGTDLDKDKTIGLPKGGFVRDIAQGVHYDGAKDEPLWIQISGIGPATSTTYEPPK
jgi:quercetin dioxygenase-like cupin family protein